jgi:hypothetical protein
MDDDNGVSCLDGRSKIAQAPAVTPSISFTETPRYRRFTVL